MKVYIGSDHAGYELKEEIVSYLTNKQIEVVNCGTYSKESVDYPDFVKKVCPNVLGDTIGILVCYTGIGMSMASNKYNGIRAALVGKVEDAILTREHNDANVLCLSQKNTSVEDALAIVDAFMSTTFLGERHERRVQKIMDIENEERKSTSSI